MNKLLFFLAGLLIACYPKIEIPTFDRAEWKLRKVDCESGINQAEVVLLHQEKVLSNGQASVIALLGEPEEHELYKRNEKFFHYDLGADSCKIRKRLSIRFNALDLAKEVAIDLKSND